MSVFVFGNNILTTLAGPITSSATSVTLASSANLPSVGAGQRMALTFNDAATLTVFEVVYVTAITGATLTIVRGQEGTTAQNWNTGDFAFGGVTEGILNSFLQNTPFTSSSVSNPGFIVFPGSPALIENFGTSAAIASNGGIVNITYPQAFTTAVLGVTTGVDDTSSGYDLHEKYSSTLTTLTLQLYGGPSSISAPVSWRAIGY